MFKSTVKMLLPAIVVISLLGCKGNKSIFQSDCNPNILFRKVSLTELVTHPEKYDRQYVEVSGRYKESFEQSALFNDSLFADHSASKAIWVDFSPDCPLYLKGTRTGLFEYHDGEFTRINNKSVIIRGKINSRNKGYLKQYRASIGQLSSIEL